MKRAARVLGAIAIGGGALSSPGGAHAQELGHKVLGGLGVDAGTQSEPGIYVANRFIYYAARRLRDRDGEVVPVQSVDIEAAANAIGVSGTFTWPRLPYLTVAAAAPVAHVELTSVDPRANVDRFGLGDVFVQPLKIGWRFPRGDVVASYAFYVPTRAFDPIGGGAVSRGHWTHQLSLGVAGFVDATRRLRASALASYELNMKKQDVDVTRGETVRIEGGAGARLLGVLDLGVAAYALGQVRDDRGSEVPAALRGARDRVYGLGPEIGVVIPMLRVRLTLRAMWDIEARSRPEGRVLVAQIAALALPGQAE